jgi:excisionase family DNA binding protein
LIDAFAPVEETVKPVLTTSEAAQQLGISKSTLIRAVNRGQVQPAFRTPGRHLRFTYEELNAIRRSLGFAVREAS